MDATVEADAVEAVMVDEAGVQRTAHSMMSLNMLRSRKKGVIQICRMQKIIEREF